MRRIVLVSVVLGFVLFAAGLGYLLGRKAFLAPLGEYAELQPDVISHDALRPVDWKLARNLALRVTNRFVAQRGQPGAGDIVFFVKPKPYSSFLCRVDAFQFAAKVVRGRTNKGEYWADDLAIKRYYALWRLPDEPERGRSPGKECRAFRDFDRLITADGAEIDIERALTHLSRASTEARKGTVTFDLKCEDSRTSQRKACDGMALLKTFDPLAVRGVQSTEHGDYDDAETVYEDMVHMQPSGRRGCGAVETLSYGLRITGPYIGGVKLLSVTAYQSTIC